ncbi:molybdopterin-binding protein [candidate division KSB3 bacterium]|uniref:Molybdopterin molybdenumtransferase n=1 Tax=candidate division KSB3 bacterium TaxID=2044937 RepID=A0A2G6E039_9BACT|nr:MAG: molybdopterin-binding protein [candidate division KSB3 bacterium]
MRNIIPVEEAVGMVLPHDITEIVKDVKKGVAFKKGHIICKEDIEYLKRLGKDNIYALSLTEEEIHENDAAELFAAALAGENVVYTPGAHEGKISLHAGCDGLLKIDKKRLFEFNMLGEVMCATLQTNTPVKKGENIAASRLIPLVGKRQLVEKAVEILKKDGPVVAVKALPSLNAGMVITGNEVFYGRIEDRFEAVLREKLTTLGSQLTTVRKAPDNKEIIAEEIHACLDEGAELIITSGGMSVDPDDVTREGIILAGAEDAVYGTPVLPGAMFLSGTIEKDGRIVPILGLPACGMFHKITVLDLVLPRVMLQEKIGREELAMLGHGGLCRNCKECHYPVCSFGK